MRILLADNHALGRDVLKRLLGQTFKDVEFGEAEDNQQAINAALAQPWDLIMLEIAMSGGSLEVLKKIHAARPGIPVLIVSRQAGQSFLTRVIQAGAAGYLDKTSTIHDLIEAVRQVLSGKRYINQTLVEQWASTLDNTVRNRLDEQLSDREFAVMLRIASGRQVSEIASDMRLSVSSIATYRSRILKKLKMLTNVDLMRYAIQHQLVECGMPSY